MERLGVVIGSGELLRPTHLQPLGVGGRAGTGARQARCLEHRISGGTNSQGRKFRVNT